MMKTVSAMTIIVLFFLPTILLGAELSSDETRNAQYEKVFALILAPNTNAVTVVREIERLEKMYETSPDALVFVWDPIVSNLVSNNHDTGRWSALINKLNKRIIAQKTESSQAKGCQIGTIVCYMTVDAEDLPSEILTNRKVFVTKLLRIWQDVFDSIEPNWNANDPQNILPPYWPPVSFTEVFNSGQSPDSIRDPKVKKEYTEYLEKRENLLKKSIERSEAKGVVQTEEKRVKKYIIDLYSIRPFAATELETLLNKYNVDDVFAKEILDAVKDAEKNAPPLSEYRRWQSKDGLFRTKAKYISSDETRVTLERKDGKQTGMDIDDLREIDQRFIKEVFAPQVQR